MRLGHRLRVLRGWAYDHGFPWLTRFVDRNFTMEKPLRASSFNGRHNRFPSLKLSIIVARTKSYTISGAVTGDLWGNGGSVIVNAPSNWGAVTGDLWGNGGPINYSL